MHIEFRFRYTIPHPTKHNIVLRIQAKQGTDARSLLMRALYDSKAIFQNLKTSFEAAYKNESIAPSHE